MSKNKLAARKIAVTIEKNHVSPSDSWPGTGTFIPQRPVTRFIGNKILPRTVSFVSTSLVSFEAEVISMLICAR
jgi:hypothetical protein